MQVEIIEDFKGLAALEEPWNELTRTCSSGWPMLTHAWVVSYIENLLGPSEKWFCVAVSENGKLKGVLPLIWDSQATNRHAHPPLYSDLIMAPSASPAVLGSLLSTAAGFPGSSHCVIFSTVRPDSSLHDLPATSRRPVWFHREADGFGSFNRIEGDFDTFLAGLSTNHRSNLKKAEKKLARLPGTKVSFLTDRYADPRYVNAFIELEASGYKGIPETGGFAIQTSPARTRFYRSLVDRLARLGALEWHVLEGDGKVIAMHMAFRINSMLTLYKISYDEDYRDCSPGKLLVLRMFQDIYLGGQVRGVHWITDLPFHSLWNVQKLPYSAYRVFPRTIRSWVASYLPRKTWSALRDSPTLGGPLKALRRRLGR